MDRVIIYTKDNNKYTTWCDTNDMKMFRDFLQYLLDNYKDMSTYYVMNCDSEKLIGTVEQVTNDLHMRKRTQAERLINVNTGIWEGLELA